MSIETVKLIAIDVDGTLTDGNYYINEAGDVYKNFFTRDMYAIDQAAKNGFQIVFLTGSRDRVIYAKVGKKYPILSGCDNKFVKLSEYIIENKLSWEEVAYIGDAENDYKCIVEAAFSGCPSDAVPEIIEHSVYSSHFSGGKGAVYDVIRYFYRLRRIPWALE
jgi:3-deoxy-D-manno-octulosonate 8-phosphate phosphatase (KDO 8-P phosphatase)